MPRELGLARFTLALALAHSGDEQRAEQMARSASSTLEEAGDDWGAAAAHLIHATAAARGGDVATVDAMAAAVLRHSDAIGYDAFRLPGLLLEAWVAERRGQSDLAEERYRSALDLAGRVGFGDHAAFALSGLGALALGKGATGGAEEYQRRALATAEGAHATWAAAHARVQLAGIAAAGGDVATAVRLYREVLEWSKVERSHQARESLFIALAGSPATAAALGSRSRPDRLSVQPTDGQCPRGSRGRAGGTRLASHFANVRGESTKGSCDDHRTAPAEGDRAVGLGASSAEGTLRRVHRQDILGACHRARPVRPLAGSYEVAPEKTRIELAIDADSLDTGNATRDKHLRSDDFFDAARHPQVRFASSRVRAAGDGTLLVEGELEAAGNVVPLTFTAHALPVEDGLEVTAETAIDQRLLGMSSGPLGMIRPPATVSVKARLRPQWHENEGRREHGSSPRRHSRRRLWRPRSREGAARAPVDVTVVDRQAHHLFQPLLYQVATGVLSEGNIAPPASGRPPPPAQRGGRPRRCPGSRARAAYRHLRPARPDVGASLRQPDRRPRRSAVVLRPRRVRTPCARR